MKCLDFQYSLKVLTKNILSCSLVNADGTLIFSKDQGPRILTTTRLVAFQIVKKYLKPQPGDLFILNDPENGGYQFSHLIFITSITPNLFLIWDEELHFVDFKIPPTPLYDQGVKNEFVWKALIHSHPFSTDFETFVLLQKLRVDRIAAIKDIVAEISSKENQAKWLKSTQEIFNIQFNNKALGSFETQHKLKNNQFVKLNFLAEERQNLKLFTLDFTNTNLATDLHAASHVVESAVIKKLAEFYEFGEFFTQSILDKIKIILPPRSIVSKPHPTGEGNLDIQAVCSQLCDFNLQQLNSHTRKPQVAFQFVNFLNFQIQSDELFVSSQINANSVLFTGFEDLITHHHIEVTRMRRSESQNQLSFKVTSTKAFKLKINNRPQNSEISLKVNDSFKDRGLYELKNDDKVEIEWR